MAPNGYRDDDGNWVAATGTQYVDPDGDVRNHSNAPVNGRTPLAPGAWTSQDAADLLLKNWGTQGNKRTDAANAAVKVITDENEAKANTARTQFDETNKANAANAAKTPPLSLSTYVPGSLKALEAITGVEINPDLAGTNAAADTFYVPAPNVNAQYNIAASPSAGDLGTRFRPSSTVVVPNANRLGSHRRSNF